MVLQTLRQHNKRRSNYPRHKSRPGGRLLCACYVSVLLSRSLVIILWSLIRKSGAHIVPKN